MKKPPFVKIALCLFVLAGFVGASGHGDVSGVLLGLIIVLLAAKIGGDLAIRTRQPEVLGELIVGVLLGNLALANIHVFDFIKTDSYLSVLSELGVILLLFEVGLETSVQEMMKVGISSLLAALLGVVAPFFLGMFCSQYFMPQADILVHVFVGATLTATSVGITARVLKDLGKIKTDEGKIILGAAVIDDVLGLLVLAVVTGIISATNAGTPMDIGGISYIIAVAVGFLAAAIILGNFVSPMLFKVATCLRSHGILLASSLCICFALSYLAGLVKLAPIVGAFTAGLILKPVHYKELSSRAADKEIDELIAPIAALLVPIFFITMGAKVDLTVFAQANILGYAFWLTLAAIIGKQVCSLGVLAKGADKLSVGLGMIPRGEVGLIFAGIGAGLTLQGQPVIDSGTFAAVIIMVIVTTMVTPPAIKWRFGKISASKAEESEAEKAEPQQEVSSQAQSNASL
jgi:Kef-type K+ transport system membrane component KefB